MRNSTTDVLVEWEDGTQNVVDSRELSLASKKYKRITEGSKVKMFYKKSGIRVQ